jgi:hypothetical protein
MKKTFIPFWDNLLPAFQAKALPADAAAQENLKQAIENLVVPPVKNQP